MSTAVISGACPIGLTTTASVSNRDSSVYKRHSLFCSIRKLKVLKNANTSISHFHTRPQKEFDPYKCTIYAEGVCGSPTSERCHVQRLGSRKMLFVSLASRRIVEDSGLYSTLEKSEPELEDKFEMRNPGLINDLNESVEDARKLEADLQDLYRQIRKLIDDGDESKAHTLVDANYQVLLEQLDSGVQGLEQAAMLDILTQCYMDLGDEKHAECLLTQLKKVVATLPDSTMVAAILDHMGGISFALKQHEEALVLYNRCLKIEENILGKDSPYLAKVLLGLARVHAELENITKSVQIYYHLLDILEESKGLEDESLIIPLSHLGHMLVVENKVAEAEHCLNRARNLIERLYGAKDCRYGFIICALARIKHTEGDFDATIELFQRGLKILSDSGDCSQADPAVEAARTEFAEVLSEMGRNEEAAELLELNLYLKEQTLGSEHPALIMHFQNLAMSYANLGKLEESAALLKRCLELVTSSFGANSPQVSVPLELLSNALHHLGRDSEAEPLARQALLLREGAYGINHPVTGTACNCLAAILHSLGLDDESEKLMCRVLKIQEAELGPNHKKVMLTLKLLVMLNDKLGRVAEAKSLYKRLKNLKAVKGYMKS